MPQPECQVNFLGACEGGGSQGNRGKAIKEIKKKKEEEQFKRSSVVILPPTGVAD